MRVFRKMMHFSDFAENADFADFFSTAFFTFASGRE
jgi:hypothetical protein